MKFSILFFAIATAAILVSKPAFAKSQVSNDAINEAGLRALIANSEKLSSSDGKRVSDILSQWLITSSDTHNKIANKCEFDANDELFNCMLSIQNIDDKVESKTESAVMIRYQLEQDSNSALPSKEMFYLNVDVVIAG